MSSANSSADVFDPKALVPQLRSGEMLSFLTGRVMTVQDHDIVRNYILQIITIVLLSTADVEP